MNGVGESRRVLRSDNGMEFVLGDQIAYRGREGCTNAMCTRMIHRNPAGDYEMGKCMGWHCSRCDAPCSSQGHKCPASATTTENPSSPSTPGEGSA